MKPMVHSVEDAKEWFMQNSSGTLICVKKDGTEKEVDCYPDAVAFFAE